MSRPPGRLFPFEEKCIMIFKIVGIAAAVIAAVLITGSIMIFFAPLFPGYAEEVQREEEDRDEANLC